MPHHGLGNPDGGLACAILYFGTAPGPVRSATIAGYAAALGLTSRRDCLGSHHAVDFSSNLIRDRILGAIRTAKLPDAEIKQFRDEATAGDYDHLFRTCVKGVEVE